MIERISTYIDMFNQGNATLGQILQEDPTMLWLLIALGILLLALLLGIILLISKKKKEPLLSEETTPEEIVFVPIEPMESGPDSIMLPLDRRIVEQREGLEPENRQALLESAPRSLSLIVNIYPQCSEKVQQELKDLVLKNNFMTDYAQHLSEKDYPLRDLIQGWSYFPDMRALQSYVELLASPSEETQMLAVRLLSGLQEPKVLTLLVLTLARIDRYTPARIAEVFASMPKQSANLLSYILPEINDTEKSLVLDILAQIRVAFPPENVLKCLKHKNPTIRCSAALALGASGMTEVVPDLIMATVDKKWEGRAAAAKALGMIGDIRSLNALTALEKDSEGWVSAAATEALRNFEK